MTILSNILKGWKDKLNEEEFYNSFYVPKFMIDAVIEKISDEFITLNVTMISAMVKKEIREVQDDQKIKQSFKEIIIYAKQKSYEMIDRELEAGLKSAFHYFDKEMERRKNGK